MSQRIKESFACAGITTEKCADTQTGAIQHMSTDMFGNVFCSSVPVLSTFLMTKATCPFSIELSNLTMRMRQVQRTSRERARRMRPAARSDRLVSTKRCLPAKDEHGTSALCVITSKKIIQVHILWVLTKCFLDPIFKICH